MRQIGFIAAQDGQVVKYDASLHSPKPRQPLTRHQRATLYFKAVRFIHRLFQEVGFRDITLENHSSFTAELGRFILDITVKESNSMPIAHVTSYPGYTYDPETIRAKVTGYSLGEHGEYVIQVGAVLPNMRSSLPTFVVIDKDSPNPLKDAFMNTLAAAKQLIQQDPETLRKIQAALASRNLEKDFEKFSSEDDTRQLPRTSQGAA